MYGSTQEKSRLGGATRSHKYLDVLAAMATNETEVSTGGFVGELKRSGVQSPLHIRISRKFCNPYASPWEVAQA